MNIVPSNMCTESTPSISGDAQFQVINSNLIFLSGITKPEYLVDKDKLEGYTYLAKSIDGGKNWTKFDPPTSEGFKKTYKTQIKLTTDFVTESIGFVYSDMEGESAFFTADSGMTYEKIPHNSNEFVNAVYLTNEKVLFFSRAVGYSSIDPPKFPFLRIYNLVSKNITEIQLPNLGSYAANSVIFVKRFNNDIIVSYHNSVSATSENRQTFYRSQDFGDSFQEIVPQNERKGIIRFYNTNLAYRIYQNQLSVSIDLGDTWNLVGEYPSTYPSNTNVPDFISNQYLYLRTYKIGDIKYYTSEYPTINWQEFINLSPHFLLFHESSFAKDSDRFFFTNRNSKIASTIFPFTSEVELSLNPIRTHYSDTLKVINRFELMALGYFCLIF